MIEITDDMCRRAVEAFRLDRIQGFSTPYDDRRKWGPPHIVRDVGLPPEQQELWRGDDHDEMMERCCMEEMRLVLHAALADGQVAPETQKTRPGAGPGQGSRE